jgi:hypothetical protein
MSINYDSLKQIIQKLYENTPDNVHSVSYGYKTTDGQVTDQLSIIFSVDNQLVRRLKLSSINCNIKTLSVEDRILRLLDISKEFETEKTTPFGYNYSTSFYSYNNVDYNEGIYILKEERKAQKQYQKYQSKQFSQMTNRFSKKGFKK